MKDTFDLYIEEHFSDMIGQKTEDVDYMYAFKRVICLFVDPDPNPNYGAIL